MEKEPTLNGFWRGRLYTLKWCTAGGRYFLRPYLKRYHTCTIFSLWRLFFTIDTQPSKGV